MIVAGLLLVQAMIGVTGALAAEQVAIQASVEGNGVVINATAIVNAPYNVIWQTLTDYDHLSDFVPGMDHSQVIGRHGTAVTVQQSGHAGLSFLRYPINVVVESDEHPPSAITIRVLSGNLRRLTGGYTLAAVPGQPHQFVLSWNGLIEPEIALPDFIAVPVLKSNIEDQFLAMVREIERKAALHVSVFVEK